MRPTVSILIPVFNREPLIAECIQSALDQTYTDFEIVVVDNASDDGTWQICQAFAQKDKRVRIFRNSENIGPVRNWMRCAQEARGTFCKMLFSDDLLGRECLAKMVPFFENPDVALCYCAAQIGENLENSQIAYALGRTSRFNTKHYANLVLLRKAPVSPGAVLMRRKDFLLNLKTDIPSSTPRPYSQHGAGPDVLVSLLTTKHYRFVVAIPDPLVFFRKHPDSFTTNNEDNQVTLGYRSALSYYVKEEWGKKAWLCYVARTWLLEARRKRRWISIRAHLREYEGSGVFEERAILIGLAVLHLLAYLLRFKIACVR